MDDETPMPFGKHKGTAMANVPATYLLWLFDQIGNDAARLTGWNHDIYVYVNSNMDALQKEVCDG